MAGTTEQQLALLNACLAVLGDSAAEITVSTPGISLTPSDYGRLKGLFLSGNIRLSIESGSGRYDAHFNPGGGDYAEYSVLAVHAHQLAKLGEDAGQRLLAHELTHAAQYYAHQYRDRTTREVNAYVAGSMFAMARSGTLRLPSNVDLATQRIFKRAWRLAEKAREGKELNERRVKWLRRAVEAHPSYA